jgi:hypothetical protein
VLVLEWRMDLQRLGVDPAGIIVGSTCTAVSLMQTPLLDVVCCCSLPEGLAVLVGEKIPAWSVSTPVGKEMLVIWLILWSADGLPKDKKGSPVPSEESGGASSWVLEGNPPSEVSTSSNLSLFKLMLAMYVLVLFSMGEQEFPLGQRDRWLVCWLAFDDLSFGLETFGMLVQW